MKRAIIIGAGAIGGSIGALLHESGTPVVLIARGAHLQVMRREGLSLRLPDRGLVVQPPVAGHVADIDWSDGDVAVLAVKLQDAETVLDQLKEAAGSDVPVVCATNGVHAERWAAERFTTVLKTMVWMPATHLVPGEVRLHSSKSPGVLDTGPYPGGPIASAETFCAALRSAGFDAIARDDIDRWTAAKWITNLGGGAQALVEDDWLTVAKAAQAEGAAILDAAGVARVPSDEFQNRVAEVDCLPVDGEKRGGGSTWQSRRRGVPLETPWIEGAVAELAESIGRAAPINAMLAAVATAPRSLTAAEVLSRSTDAEV